MRLRRQTSKRTIRLPMSPMIDIIFLLLIFFVMTFQIVPLEGDLTIAAPPRQTDVPADSLDIPIEPPLHVRLIADNDGTLKSIEAAGLHFESTTALAQHVRKLYADGPATDTEAVIKADGDLNYHHMIDTVTALSGYVDDTGRTVTLISKVRFAP